MFSALSAFLHQVEGTTKIFLVNTVQPPLSLQQFFT
jgi:hypothetical protein